MRYHRGDRIGMARAVAHAAQHLILAADDRDALDHLVGAGGDHPRAIHVPSLARSLTAAAADSGRKGAPKVCKAQIPSSPADS